MHTFIQLGFLVLSAALCFSFWQKNRIVYGGSIQCSSGDSEVMIFNFNFLKGETEDSKASKLSEAFQMIQDRRDENHEKFLAIREQAIKENQIKEENGEELKLRSITEGKK